MANVDIFVLANDWPSWAPVTSSSHLLWAVVSTSALKPLRCCAGLSCSVPCGCHLEGSGHWSVLWLISQGGWKAGVGPVCVQLGSDQESINDRVIAFLRAPSAVFLVTSGSLVFLYLASRSESWALIYWALSEPSARRTVRGDSWGFAAFSGPGEEGAPVLWSLRPLQPPCHCDCGRKASRQECKEAEKKKAQGGFPHSLCISGVPFRIAQARKRGSLHLRSPLSYCSSQKEGLPARLCPSLWLNSGFRPPGETRPGVLVLWDLAIWSSSPVPLLRYTS